jgi:U3 small nucleolar RNA-associated protein 13
VAHSNGEASAQSSNAPMCLTKCTRTWKPAHVAPIVFMCFDSSSTLFATVSSDYTTKIWDLDAQYCTHNLKSSNNSIVRHFKFHPSIDVKQQCISGSEDGKLRVYDLNTSKMSACLEGHFSTVTCFEYVKQSETEMINEYNRLLSSSKDKVLILWDLIGYTQLKTIPIYESIESFLICSQLFENASAELEKELDLNEHVMTIGSEGIFKLWSLKNGKLLFKQNDQFNSLRLENKKRNNRIDDEAIQQVIYNKLSRSFVVLTTYDLISFFQINTNNLSSILKQNNTNENISHICHISKQLIGNHGEILDAHFCDKNNNYAAIATNSEIIKIYNLKNWNCSLLKEHTDLVICLSVYIDSNNDKCYLASSSKDSTIKIWELSFDNQQKEQSDSNNGTFTCVANAASHSQDVSALCFSRLGFDFLVSGSIDTTIKLWSLENIKKNSQEKVNLRVLNTIKAHEKDVNYLTISPNDKLLASGSSDKTAKVILFIIFVKIIFFNNL